MSTFEETDESVDWGRKGSQMLVTLACLVVVLAGMKAAAGVLVPLACAFFLAVLSFPLLRWLTRRRFPAPLALAATLLVNLSVLAGLITLGVRLLIKFNGQIPNYLRGLQRYLNDMAGWLESHGITGARELIDGLFDWNTIIGYVTQQDVMTRLWGMVGNTFGTLATGFGGLVMVLILLMFILMEAPGTRTRMQTVKMAGGPDFSGLIRSVSDIQKYLGVKTLISALTGLFAGVWCYCLDLQYPLLWALMAFLFNYIPVVGSTIACVPPVVEALVQYGTTGGIWVAVGYGGINFCLDNFLQPALMGRKFGISPLVVILSVVFWGWLWGPLGMFLAVPLTMVFKVLLDHSDEFRWISIAMAKKKIRRGEVEVAGYDLMADGEPLGGGAATESPERHR